MSPSPNILGIRISETKNFQKAIIEEPGDGNSAKKQATDRLEMPPHLEKV